MDAEKRRDLRVTPFSAANSYLSLLSLEISWLFRFVFIIVYGHTAGSLLLEDGVDIKTIQEFLGHSQASTTTNTYLHCIVRGGHVTANSMNRIIV